MKRGPGDCSAWRSEAQKNSVSVLKILKKLSGEIFAFYHLAVVDDLEFKEESQVAVNADGARNTVEFAKTIDAEQFHHVRSIAAPELYEGVFAKTFLKRLKTTAIRISKPTTSEKKLFAMNANCHERYFAPLW